MYMVAHGEEPQHLDTGVRGSLGEAVEDGLIAALAGAEEKLPPGAATCDQVDAAGQYGSGTCHVTRLSA
jgi:hypothetical protein